MQGPPQDWSIFKAEDKRFFIVETIGIDVIKRVIVFDKLLHYQDVYNVGFGVYSETEQSVSDTLEPNNGDMKLVMQKTVWAIEEYTLTYPNRIIVIIPNTEPKKHLYSYSLSNYLSHFVQHFTIKSVVDLTRDESDVTKKQVK